MTIKNIDISYKPLYKVAIIQLIKNMLNSSSVFIIALFLSKILNLAISGQNNILFKKSLIFILFIIIYNLINFILDILVQKLSNLDHHKFKIQIYKKFYSQNINSINKLTVGDVKERFNDDVTTSVNFITQILPNTINNLILALSYFCYISSKNIICGLSLLTIGLLQCIPPIIIKKYLAQNYEDTRQIEAELTELIISGYNGLSTIKFFNLYDWFQNKLHEIHKRYSKIGSKSEITGQAEYAMYSTIDAILTFGTYALMGIYVLFNLTTTDLAIQFIVLSNSLYDALKNLFSIHSYIIVFKKTIIRLSDITNENNMNEDSLCKDLSKISLTQLNFSYDNYKSNDTLLLKDVNLYIENGEKIAIIGENGCGKSTLFKLLMGLYDNYNGEILYNDKNMKSINKESYFKQISWLPQEDNTFLKSPLEFFEMLTSEGLIDLAEALSLSYKFGFSDELLNKKISNLSGGERKKVYLIASLLKNSSTIFLDEPTNSLDLSSQKLLFDIIKNSNKTFIIVCHNKEILDACNVIIEIKDKKVHTFRKEILKNAK